MKACSQPRSSEEISNIMRRVRSRNTTPELAFRQALWAKGLRYKLHHGELPGKPDIVFPAKRLAVFVDGDYWHGGQSVRRNLASLEEQFSKSQSISYWLEKIRGNMNRDCVSTARLLASGWRVLRFWASEIEKNLDRCVEMTLAAARNEIPPTPLAHLPYKTFAEFFAGIGLVRMALERQGWTVAYANDVDPKKKEMYDTHFQEESLFHLGDIHHIRSDEIPCVTLATASFPCNDLSVAGARRGLKGKQSSAFWGLVSAIEGMGGRRPPLILLENVTGFLTSHKGRDLSEAMLALNRLGYSIDAFVLDAAQFVPQSRERLFVVAVLNDGYQAPGMLDAMSLQEDQLRPRRLVDFIKKHPEIRWKIRKLPKPPQKRASLPDVLQDLPDESSAWWSRERAEYLLNQMSPRHREVAELMIAGAAWSYGTVFRRIRNGQSRAELRFDGIAGCLRTPRGGSGRQILFKAGHGKYFARLLTPRECARLMGADDYRIIVPANQALFGFGDAVCVPVIEWIGQYYLNPLVQELLHGRLLHEQPADKRQ